MCEYCESITMPFFNASNKLPSSVVITAEIFAFIFLIPISMLTGRPKVIVYSTILLLILLDINVL